MSVKARQIKLGYSRDTESYVVISVKNGTDPSPGEVLTRRQVDGFVMGGHYDVIVVAYNPRESSDGK